jgi:ferredoxin
MEAAVLDRVESHQITILDTGEQFACAALQPVLKAMVTLGRKGIPSGCHGGGCGVCKIKVVAGQYWTEPMSRDHVSEAEEAQGVALACRTFPLTDIRLEVLGKMRKNVTKGVTKKYGFV